MIRRIIKSKYLTSSFWAFSKYFLGIVKSIVLVPLFLVAWGKELYSYWLLIMSALMLIQTINLGHLQYIGNEINLQFHKDKQKAYYTFASGSKMALLVIIFQILLSSLFLSDHVVSTLLGIDHSKIGQIGIGYMLFFFFVAGIVQHCSIRLLPRLFEPIGEISKEFRLEFILASIELLMMVVMLSYKFSLNNFLSVFFYYYIVSSIVLLYIFHRLFPQYFSHFSKGSIKYGWQNFLKSLGFLLSNISDKANNESLPLVVAYLFSALVVPVFFTIKTLTNLIVIGTNLIATIMVPEMQRMYTKRQGNDILRYFRINRILVGAPVNLGVVIFFPMSKPIFEFWVKNKIEFNPTLFVYLLAAAIVVNYGAVVVYFVRGLNKAKSILMFSLARIVILYSVLILGPEKIETIGLGVFLAELVVNVLFVSVVANRIFIKMNVSTYIREAAIGLLPLAITGAYLFFSLHNFSWYLMIFSIVLLVFYYAYLLKSSDLGGTVKIGFKKLF